MLGKRIFTSQRWPVVDEFCRTSMTCSGMLHVRFMSSFKLRHTLISSRVDLQRVEKPDGKIAYRAEQEEEFPVFFAGDLSHDESAFSRILSVGESDGRDESVPSNSGNPSHDVGAPVFFQNPKFQIFTPDKRPFTAREITRAHLEKYRDLQGIPTGKWSYKFTSESTAIPSDKDVRTYEPGHVNISVTENIHSSSAPPLIDETFASPGLPTLLSFPFDLFRIGQFVANVVPNLAESQWRGSMRLFDPDNNEVQHATDKALTFDVKQRHLNKSRDIAGQVRNWRLEVRAQNENPARVDTPAATPTRRPSTLGGFDANANVSTNSSAANNSRLRAETIATRDTSLPGSSSGFRVSANVIGTSSIHTSILNERINTMLGPHGEYIEIYGENKGDDVLIRLKVNNKFSAETIDMYSFLSHFLKTVIQDKGVDVENFEANQIYTIFRRSKIFDIDLVPIINSGADNPILDFSTFKVNTIDLDVSQREIGGEFVPALKLTVTTSGSIKARLSGKDVAEIKVINDGFSIEVGVKIAADGTPKIITQIPSAIVTGHVAETETAVAAGVGVGIVVGPGTGILTGGAIISTQNKLDAKLEEANKKIHDNLENVFADPSLAPRIMMMFLGAHFTYLPTEFRSEEIKFHYVAPVEPEPKPTPGYQGAIGRSIKASVRPDAVTFSRPHDLAATWRADNFNIRNESKIEHIVVVMMENRSYDHVLGYRAQLRDVADTLSPELVGNRSNNLVADGLSTEMIQAITVAENHEFKFKRISETDFPKTGSITCFPHSVGHELHDVKQQLGERPISVELKSGTSFAFSAFTVGEITRLKILLANEFDKVRTLSLENDNFKKVAFTNGETYEIKKRLSIINTNEARQLSNKIITNQRQVLSPRGFVENFKSKLANDRDTPLKPDDVLAYYEKELPFFDYLAQNYAYSDTYFCSHAGPTLPNRMFSLTGNLQYDRYGFPIVDNNNSDNFLLSRAPTIFDLMERKNVSYRVYESNPSVTMLRMFARYATDTKHIVPFDNLEADVQAGNLPKFTVIDPRMHSWPPNDDHPPADMYYGQEFLRGVYMALTRNPEIWKKTMLIITYDEHGGFYDHVVPPLADVCNTNMANVIPGREAQPPVRPLPDFRNTNMVNIDSDQGAPPSVDNSIVKVSYGLRVPTFVVSPWVKPGKGPDVILDHCSILKTALVRFFGEERPFMSDRVHASNSFEPFLTATEPRMNVPEPPVVPKSDSVNREAASLRSKFFSKPLSRKAMRENAVDFHQITEFLARQLDKK